MVNTAVPSKKFSLYKRPTVFLTSPRKDDQQYFLTQNMKCIINIQKDSTDHWSHHPMDKHSSHLDLSFIFRLLKVRGWSSNLLFRMIFFFKNKA